MTPRESFKHGFLARCIEAGFTEPAQIRDMLKTALEKQGGVVGDVAGAGAGLLKTLGMIAIPTLAAGPALLGGAGGYLAGKATDIDETDVDEMKKRELIDEYHTQAARLQREGEMRRRLAANQRKPGGSFF